MKTPKKSLTALICGFALLNLTQPAFAIKDEDKAAEPMYRFIDPNPAKIPMFSPARVRLPSLRINMGSNLPITQDIQDIARLSGSFAELFNATQSDNNTQTQELGQELTTLLGKFENGFRLDYDLDLALAGYSGTPFPNMTIAGRPLSLGFNVGSESRSFVSVDFSEEFRNEMVTLGQTLPDLFSSGTEVAQLTNDINNVVGQSQSLVQNVNQLSALSAVLLAKNSATPGEIQQFQNLVDQVVNDANQFVDPAEKLSNLAKSSTATAQTLIDSLSKNSSGGININAANDTHLTFNLSAAYPVIENDDLKLSLGTNVKLFVMPFQLNTQSLGVPGQGDLGLLGQLKIDQIEGFDNLNNLEQTLTNVNSAVEDVDSLIASAKKITTEIEQTKSQLTTDNIDALKTQAGSLINDLSTINTQIQNSSQNFQNATQSIANLNNAAAQDLENVKIKGSMITPDGAGVGLDFGVEALIRKNLRLALMVQNPIVLWGAKETPFEIQFKNQNGQTQTQINTLTDQITSTNYTGTVPLTVLATSQYRFDDLLPDFKGLYANAMFQYMTNGRSPGLTLSLQKDFGVPYVGLGGRFGGATSMLFAQAGLRHAGPFGLDFQIGVAPTGTGIPGVGLLNMAGLGMYLQF